MYPGPSAPTLGTFVADIEAGLEARGHDLARAVVDRRGGHGRHLEPRPRRRPERSTLPAGRRLRALPRSGGAARRDRGTGTRRPDRPRPGRRERRALARDARRDPSRRAACGVGDRGLRLAAAAPRGCSARRVGQDDRDRLRRRSRPVRAGGPRGGSRRGRLGAGGNGVPLRRHAQRAEERHPPRRRLRAPRRGVARVRRGRAAPRGARRAARCPRRRSRRPRRRAHDGSRQRTSCASRASSSLSGWQRSRRWRAPARSSRRGWAALPSSSRPGRACSSTRRTRRRSPRGCAAAAELPRPNEAARTAAEAHDVRRQVERIEALLESATRAPAAAGAPVERR